jgi:hypothetical protein
MSDASLIDATAQRNAAAEQAALAASGVPLLGHWTEVDGAAAFDWRNHTPGDLAAAYRTVAFWQSVASRALGDSALAYAGGKALSWAIGYGALPVTLSYGTAGVLTDAADAIQTSAVNSATASSTAKADALVVAGNLRGFAGAAQALADGATWQGRLNGWIATLEGWAKVAALVVAAVVATALGWGAYRTARWVRGR